jgi:GMP reductase
MRIEDDLKLDYDDVLIRPKRSTLSSRKEVDLFRGYKFLNSNKEYYGIPIMASNMDTIGTLNVAKVLYNHNLITVLHKHHKPKDFVKFIDDGHMMVMKKYISVSLGISNDDFQNFRNISEVEFLPEMAVLDVANGYQQNFVDRVKEFRDKYPNVNIVAGNVVTAEQTEELLLAGADIIKVGIGPGSACTTRIKTGVGYPQLSAVIECADAAHGLGGHIVADGGCKNPGDVAKAFAAGADFVMLGGMFAGTNETGNVFYGSSSNIAMKIHSKEITGHRTSEGREVELKNKGSLDDVVLDILGGLRSACTYVGASTLKQLSKRTTFIRVNSQYNKVYENQTIGD